MAIGMEAYGVPVYDIAGKALGLARGLGQLQEEQRERARISEIDRVFQQSGGNFKALMDSGLLRANEQSELAARLQTIEASKANQDRAKSEESRAATLFTRETSDYQRNLAERDAQRAALATAMEGFQAPGPEQYEVQGSALQSPATGEIRTGFVPRSALERAQAAWEEGQTNAADIQSMAPLAKVGVFDKNVGEVFKALRDERTGPLARRRENRLATQAEMTELGKLQVETMKAAQKGRPIKTVEGAIEGGQKGQVAFFSDGTTTFTPYPEGVSPVVKPESMTEFKTFYAARKSEGMSDAQIADAWNKQITKRGMEIGAARAREFGANRYYVALDEGGNYVFVNPDDIRKAKAGVQIPGVEGGVSPGAPTAKAMAQRANMAEITGVIGTVRSAIEDPQMPEFSPGQAAHFAFILHDETAKPGMIRGAMRTALRSKIGQSLTPEQQTYLIALANLRESGMALRSVQGLGQGSDMVRGAIEQMLPSAGTPSKAYALEQITQLESMLDNLATGIPNARPSGKPVRGAPASPPRGGTQAPPAAGQYTDNDKRWAQYLAGQVGNDEAKRRIRAWVAGGRKGKP